MLHLIRTDSNPLEDVIFIRVNGEFHALHITQRGFKPIWRCIPQLGGEFRALHLASMGFKPIWRCIPKLGGEFRALHLVLVNFHVPRLRLVDELGASVPFVRNHATQVARVPCVHPLEIGVQRVVIMWFRDSDGVSINHRWFVLNRPRGLSRGCTHCHAILRVSEITLL